MLEFFYETNVDNLLQKVGEFKELLFVKFLKDHNDVLPAIQLSEKSRIFNALYDRNVMDCVKIINAKGFRIDLPEDLECDMVEKITIDEKNLLKILRMISNEKFPNLSSLSLTVSTKLSLQSRNLKNLKNLTLINNSNTIIEFPSLVGIHLDMLDLKGFAIAFKKSLPKVLKFERCFIGESSDLEGCEELSLFDSVWKNISFPTRILRVEVSELRGEIPKSIEILHIINTEFTLNVTDFTRLFDLRFDKVVKIEGTLPDSLKTLTVDGEFLTDEITLPNLTTLNVRGGTPSNKYGDTLTNVTFFGCELNMREQFAELTKREIRKLNFSRCIMTGEREVEIEYDEFEEVVFYMCYGKEIDFFFSKLPEKLIAIGDFIGIADFDGFLKSEILLMTEKEMKLYLLGESFSPLFTDFWKCFRDIEKYKPALLDKFFEFSYTVPLPNRKMIPKIEEKYASKILVRSGNNIIRMEYIIRLMNAGDEWPADVPRDPIYVELIGKIKK
jgi:hypothetical protein